MNNYHHLVDQLKRYYEAMPFNQVLGINIEKIDYLTGDAMTRFSMAPKLIGNSMIGILHGGVTAAVIDLTGGLSVAISCIKHNENASYEVILKKLSSSATIDMRVDYLRPGKGKEFFCTSTLIRAGSKIVVSKMDIVNEKKTRIAIGTATYLIGT